MILSNYTKFIPKKSFTCSPNVHVGFLWDFWFLPTAKKHAGELGTLNCHWVCEWVFPSDVQRSYIRLQIHCDFNQDKSVTKEEWMIFTKGQKRYIQMVVSPVRSSQRIHLNCKGANKKQILNSKFNINTVISSPILNV